MKPNLFGLVTFLLTFNFFFSNNTLANSSRLNKQSIFDVLNHQELLEVNLKMNIDSVFQDRKSEKKLPATFSFKDAEGNVQDWKIKVYLRGRFRRIKCENLPPLKLDFKKKDLKEAGLALFDDLKLVTYCVENEEEAKELLLKEYLIYKMYNEVTAQSFRVQLVSINYVDSETGIVDTQFGILIEDTAQLRARLAAEKKEKAYGLSKDKFNSNQVKVVALFNYMIGNSDWSIGLNRNIKVLDRGGKYILIPYDFDFSGFVDAPYAKIKAEHGTRNIKDRVYLGFKDDVQDLKIAKRILKKKHPAFKKIIKDCHWLSSKQRSEMINYLNSFYDEMDYFIKLPKPREQ
jgi:hypothetical protein